MSIDRCSRCGDLVDTDNEPESYVAVGKDDYVCLCRHHREEHEEEPRRMPTDWTPTMAQVAIMESDPRYGCKRCDWDVDGCSPCDEHAD